ncbi:TPA: glycosyltransferase family 2 protein [Klebsiella oxytoca]|uniref:glycosyltransferase family A protein n=1 Tax=Klebsiella oxytoca TaxID=571 RepID=UPI000668E65A|nr:glycosyltransferase family A protein [Klebsiella oxytoca]MBZ7195650.1 glycosyltransferase family 2 protein [Klebsiella oxytoca]MBZ7740557.1 glycosyltransferase family 2 protein [Klebsiella oxytoca]HAV0429683.1 glycosyltransferase family 2 protein [Klebsiella oxytoca]
MSKPKRVKRGVEKTKLLMCEGVTDKRLAECLKRLLVTRSTGFSIKIDEAGGGGPKSAILSAITHAGGFDKRVVFIDSDLPIPRDALAAASNKSVTIIQSSPFCLEGFLLRLMGHQHGIINSQDAKDTFHKIYNLRNVVTQDWYDEFITIQHINSVINNPKHECQHLMTALKNVFTIF